MQLPNVRSSGGIRRPPRQRLRWGRSVPPSINGGLTASRRKVAIGAWSVCWPIASVQGDPFSFGGSGLVGGRLLRSIGRPGKEATVRKIEIR